MPTSLITGGAGFLGSHLCDRMLAVGHRVICVDNLETGTLENIGHIRGAAFPILQHDVTEHLELIERVDLVFHAASPASPIAYLRLPLHTLKDGSCGTDNALGVAKHHRDRFLLFATSEVCGDPQEHPQREGYWGHARIFNAHGPRMRPHDGRAVSTFLRQALEETPLAVFGAGEQTRSVCDVDDLIEGLCPLISSRYLEPADIGTRASSPSSGWPRP